MLSCFEFGRKAEEEPEIEKIMSLCVNGEKKKRKRKLQTRQMKKKMRRKDA